MKFNQNFTLWIALAIPFVVILIVAGIIYWPRTITPPQHNFLYALRDYEDGFNYVVKEGKLEREQISFPGGKDVPRPITPASSGQTRFFVHSVTTNESREVSFTEAQAMSLNSDLTAPDGYELVRGGQGGGVFPFFFAEGDYESRYLAKGNATIQMSIKKPSDTNYQPFEFIGWIN